MSIVYVQINCYGHFISCYLCKYLSNMQQYEFNDWRITAITSASGQPVFLTFKFQTVLF